MFNKLVDQEFLAGKGAGALGERLLRNDELLAPVASAVQTQTIDTITDYRRVYELGSKSMAATGRRT